MKEIFESMVYGQFKQAAQLTYDAKLTPKLVAFEYVNSPEDYGLDILDFVYLGEYYCKIEHEGRNFWDGTL